MLQIQIENVEFQVRLQIALIFWQDAHDFSQKWLPLIIFQIKKTSKQVLLFTSFFNMYIFIVLFLSTN